MRRYKTRRGRWFAMVALAIVLTLALGGVALAAQFGEGAVYRLAAGEVIADDLYVSAGEIYIDGTVEGDLVATGGYIEVNGEVTQDVLAAGAGIVINGIVGDDVRAAGAGITIAGQVADDVLIAGGGSNFPGAPTWPIQIGGRTIPQGLHILDGATIGRDALVAGGSGEIAGTIGRNLWVGMGSVTISADVGGDATVYANQLTVSDAATVGGTFSYQTDSAPAIPPGVAATVTVVPPEATVTAPPPSLVERLLWWTLSVGRALVGLLVFGWLLLKLAPAWSEEVAVTMSRQVWPVAGAAVLVIVAFVPLTLIAVGIIWLFWDFFPGVLATTMFLFGLWGLLWFTSPLFSGYCLGRTLFRGQRSALLQLFLGALIILLGARIAEWIPFVGGFLGWLIMLGSFGFAVGAMLLSRRAQVAAAPAVTG